MTTYFMDPEREFEFAKVPDDIPRRFATPLYDRLWQYWLGHREIDHAKYKAAVTEIKSRQNGWCSIADVKEVGFTQFGEPFVPEEIVQRELQAIIAAEPAA